MLIQNRPLIAPRDRAHLEVLIGQAIRECGNTCSLNHLDINGMKDLQFLFHKFPEFNGDISRWTTGTVRTMERMFLESEFDGDISAWDVSNVNNMNSMFESSVFTGDISQWKVSNVIYMNGLFKNSVFNGDISRWDTGQVQTAMDIFCDSAFSGDISAWSFPKMSPGKLSGAFNSKHFSSEMPHLKNFGRPICAVFHPEYKGTFFDEYTVDMAQNLFHEVEAMECYLANTAGEGIRRLHIEYILTKHLIEKPEWCPEEVFKGLKRELVVGWQLGLNMSEICSTVYQRFKEKPIVELGTPIDGDTFLL